VIEDANAARQAKEHDPGFVPLPEYDCLCTESAIVAGCSIHDVAKGWD
jgi:hypothetical protein